MSSKDKNSSLSDTEIPSGKGMHIGIVVSEWNDEITFGLRDGCVEALRLNGVEADDIHLAYVPGAFELPLGARMLSNRAKLDGIICLGCVIKGETKHDEYINNAVATGIMQLGLATGKPVIYGVLTPNDMEQAKARAGGVYGNKGVEAAHTVLKMIKLNKKTGDKKGIGFG